MASCGSFKLRIEVCFFSLGFVLTGINIIYFSEMLKNEVILHVDTDKASMCDAEKAIQIHYPFEVSKWFLLL